MPSFVSPILSQPAYRKNALRPLREAGLFYAGVAATERHHALASRVLKTAAGDLADLRCLSRCLSATGAHAVDEVVRLTCRLMTEAAPVTATRATRLTNYSHLPIFSDGAQDAQESRYLWSRRHGQLVYPGSLEDSLGRYRRGVYSVLWRAAGSGFLGLALIGVAVGYVSFDSFSIPSLERIRQVSAAVVFTGQFDRVDVGLRLADAGAVPRLYISGVNGNVGLDPAHFVEQFSIRNPDIADLRRLVACCVEWGERADNTFQNAQDTKCWVDRRGLAGPLLLITSRQHMARPAPRCRVRSRTV